MVDARSSARSVHQLRAAAEDTRLRKAVEKSSRAKQEEELARDAVGAAKVAADAKITQLQEQLDSKIAQLQAERLHQQPGSPTTSDCDRILKEIQRIKESIEEEVLMKCAICTEVLAQHDEYKMPHTTKCQVWCAEHACWVKCSYFALC